MPVLESLATAIHFLVASALLQKTKTELSRVTDLTHLSAVFPIELVTLLRKSKLVQNHFRPSEEVLQWETVGRTSRGGCWDGRVMLGQSVIYIHLFASSD